MSCSNKTNNQIKYKGENTIFLTESAENSHSLLSKVREDLKITQENFKLQDDFHFEDFRLVANGVFQAEGHVSCRIRGRNFSPVVSLNQNYSTESLNFILILWYVLGKKGAISIILNKNNKLVIRLQSESWDTVLNIYSEYFKYIYGEKYIAFKKLLDIRRLTTDPSKEDTKFNINSLSYAIQLIYSLSEFGVNRKISLLDQLKLLNLPKLDLPVYYTGYSDNHSKFTIQFLIGFIIGDGNLFLRMRLSDEGSVWLIPILSLPQQNNKYNIHFFLMLKEFLNSNNIKFSLKKGRKRGGRIRFRKECCKLFKRYVNRISRRSKWDLWKYNSFNFFLF